MSDLRRNKHGQMMEALFVWIPESQMAALKREAAKRGHKTFSSFVRLVLAQGLMKDEA